MHFYTKPLFRAYFTNTLVADVRVGFCLNHWVNCVFSSHSDWITFRGLKFESPPSRSVLVQLRQPTKNWKVSLMFNEEFLNIPADLRTELCLKGSADLESCSAYLEFVYVQPTA